MKRRSAGGAPGARMAGGGTDLHDLPAASGPTRSCRPGWHPGPALATATCLVLLLAGCTMLVDDSLPSPSATAPDHGPSFIPETKVFRIVPPPSPDGTGKKPPTHADLIARGLSPLPGSLAGTEKVLMRVHGRGDSRIILPYQRSGALLWLLVGCEREAPLGIRTFDVRGFVVARYDLEPCRSAEGGGGTADNTSTFVEVWTSPDVEYDLSVISSELYPE